MKKINSKGFKISNADQKAFDHYLIVSPRKWSEDALNGLINKASKTILRDYFELYKSKQTSDIEADMAIIIPAIIAMEEFKPYNVGTPEMPTIDRKESASNEIWDGGFDIEDWKKQALNVFYSDVEGYMNYLMTNKVKARKDAFVKEHQQAMFKNKESIPVNQDDFINHVCAKENYKNRVQRDEEFFNEINKKN